MSFSKKLWINRSKASIIITLMLVFSCQINTSAQETICNDAIDNDGDGLIDCADGDCITTNLCSTAAADCTFNESTFSFAVSEEVVAGYFDTFILTDLNGVIMDVSMTTSFSNVEMGDYFLFHLNYQSNTVVNGNTIGMPIGELTGDCFEVSGGFKIKVCSDVFVPFNSELSVWLESSYQSNGNEMETALNDYQLLPGQKPVYFISQETPTGQPYSNGIWNYAGEEGSSFDYNIVGDDRANYPVDVVDWVLVSLRNDIMESSTFCKRAGWLTKSGAIIFPTPSDCTLTLNSEIYIVVEHRNHLPIMSPNPIVVTEAGLNFDFRSQQSYKSFMGDGQKEKGSGVFMMYSGNGDQDMASGSRSDINVTDESIIWTPTNYNGSIYSSGDYNMDGDVNANDGVFWLNNNGKSLDVPFEN